MTCDCALACYSLPVRTVPGVLTHVGLCSSAPIREVSW